MFPSPVRPEPAGNQPHRLREQIRRQGPQLIRDQIIWISTLEVMKMMMRWVLI